jgi:hypothetical protein
MNYTAIYEDPFNEDGTSEDGCRLSFTCRTVSLISEDLRYS